MEERLLIYDKCYINLIGVLKKKEKSCFGYYKEREAYTQKYHYYTENVDGYWISFPVIIEDHRVYFCPVHITP